MSCSARQLLHLQLSFSLNVLGRYSCGTGRLFLLHGLVWQSGLLQVLQVLQAGLVHAGLEQSSQRGVLSLMECRLRSLNENFRAHCSLQTSQGCRKDRHRRHSQVFQACILVGRSSIGSGMGCVIQLDPLSQLCCLHCLHVGQFVSLQGGHAHTRHKIFFALFPRLSLIVSLSKSSVLFVSQIKHRIRDPLHSSHSKRSLSSTVFGCNVACNGMISPLQSLLLQFSFRHRLHVLQSLLLQGG